MKKYFFLTVIAAFALCSCVKDEPDGLWDKTKITFESPVISTMTKAVAGEIVDPYPTSENFSVYAVYTDDKLSSTTTEASIYPYMSNVTTAYAQDINGWDPGAVSGAVSYYWPKHGYLTFAAYSPSDAFNDGIITWSAETGFNVKDFKVKDSPAEQYDLMFSKLEKNKQSSTGTNAKYQGVDIVFGHALSSIKFKMNNSYTSDGVTINITGITINNAYSKGTYTQNLNSDYSNDYDSNGSVWISHMEEVSSYEVYNGTAGTTNQNYLNTSDVILLPQALKHDEENHEVTVTVNYTMGTPASGNKPIPQEQTVSLVGLTYKDSNGNDVSIDEWEMGKRYIYTINFSFTKIYFAPSVEEWTDTNVSGPTI